MRIRISHLTTYRYDTPAGSVIQTLRLTPRNHDGQYVTRWRIDVSADCRLNQHEDAFGNITHAFTAEGPFSELSVQVEGEVETRDTELTAADADLAAFAAAARSTAGADALALLHHMLERLHNEMVFDTNPTY